MAFALGAATLAPFAVLAADTSPLQEGWHLYPTQCECPDSAPDFKCVGAVIQNLVNLAIAIGVVIFVLVASYAGVLFMASSVNPRGKEQAKSMLMSAVLGLVIALAAWLLVDFVMKALYNERWGPWNSILSNPQAEYCLVVKNPPAGPSTGTGGTGGVTGQPGGPNEPGEPGGEEPSGPAAGSFPLSGIDSRQSGDASTQLNQLLACIAAKPGTSGARITSISDDYLYTRGKTWADCRAGECQHCGSSGANSCSSGGASYHYGGTQCGDHSYAVDFNADTGTSLSNALIQAARECGGRSLSEGNHTHIQIGSCN